MGPNERKRPTTRQLDHLFRQIRQDVGPHVQYDLQSDWLTAAMVQDLLASPDRRQGVRNLVYQAIRTAATGNPLSSEIFPPASCRATPYSHEYCELIASPDAERCDLRLPKIRLEGGKGQWYARSGPREVRVALPSRKYLERTWPAATPERAIPSAIRGLVTMLDVRRPVIIDPEYEAMLESGQWRVDSEVDRRLKLMDDHLTGDVLTTWVTLGRWYQGTCRACRLEILKNGEMPLTTAQGLVSAILVPERFSAGGTMFLACTGDEVHWKDKRFCTGIGYVNDRIVIVPIEMSVRHNNVGVGSAWLPTGWG